MQNKENTRNVNRETEGQVPPNQPINANTFALNIDSTNRNMSIICLTKG